MPAPRRPGRAAGDFVVKGTTASHPLRWHLPVAGLAVIALAACEGGPRPPAPGYHQYARAGMTSVQHRRQR